MAAAPFDHLVAGSRETSAADDGHSLALLGVAPDWAFELPRFVLHHSAHERHVGTAERAVLELCRKGSMARVVEGDDDQARCALVQPVDDAWASHAPHRGPAPAAAEEGVQDRKSTRLNSSHPSIS